MGHLSIFWAQGPHAHWWKQGAAQCDFTLVKHTMHVVSPPMVDSGALWRPVMLPASLSASTGECRGVVVFSDTDRGEVHW